MPPKSTPGAPLGETPRPRWLLYLGRPLRTRHWLPNSGGRENVFSPQNWGAGGAKIDFCKRSTIAIKFRANSDPCNLSASMRLEFKKWIISVPLLIWSIERFWIGCVQWGFQFKAFR